MSALMGGGGTLPESLRPVREIFMNKSHFKTGLPPKKMQITTIFSPCYPEACQ